MISVTKLEKKYFLKYKSDISRLLFQLTLKKKEMKMPGSATHVFLLRRNGIIVGMGSLVFLKTLVAYSARMEDVVVDEKCRGMGLGGELVRFLISYAEEQGAGLIELTSNPRRFAANKLYRTLGFRLRKTNVYRMVL